MYLTKRTIKLFFRPKTT